MRSKSPAPFTAIIVAAGKGRRAGGAVPKQFALYREKPLIRHSVEAMLDAEATRVLVAIPDGWHDQAAAALIGLGSVDFVIGGRTRQQSVRNALEALADEPPALVLIHDAARPTLPASVVMRILNTLNDNSGVIPVLPVVDSIVTQAQEFGTDYLDREHLRRVQTPQGFRYGDILAAHRSWTGSPDAGDDAQVLQAAGQHVALVAGDEALTKVTFAGDFQTTTPSIRTGMGFDVHRLVEDEELWLAGVLVPYDKGLSGHSDADVGLHALVDALLGAIGAGDIGIHFPPSDSQWKGASSSKFVEHARELVANQGYRIANVDITLICEAPKIGPYRQQMQDKVAQLLAIDGARINIKATTTEGLGLTGRGEGIAAQAIATLEKAG